MAGFWNTITDAFTGRPAKEAAGTQRSYFDTIKGTGTSDFDVAQANSLAALGQGYGTGVSSVNTGADQATNYLGAGAGNALNYINAGTTGAQGALGSARGSLAQARGAYAPLSALAAKYGGATTLGLGALGVGGEAGTKAAMDAFKVGPGYNFNFTQGLDAINRRGAAAGMLRGGNPDQAAQKFGAGLASQEYDKWLGNLLGFTNPELAATTGAASGIAGTYGAEAGTFGKEADLLSGAGGQLAGIAGALGTGQAGIAGQRGLTLADLASRNAGNVAGTYGAGAQNKVGLATALASPYSKTYGDAAAAEMGGSANAWKAGLELAKLFAGQAGQSSGKAADAAKIFAPGM